MMNYDQVSEIVISCPNRISTYLAQEVESMGFLLREVFTTGVRIEGTLNDCIQLNLKLRTANQVLYKLKEFNIKTPEELYIELVNIPWENYIDSTKYFTVTCNVDTPAIKNTMFANVKVKDAIVDRIKEKVGERPNSGPERDSAVVHLFWKNLNGAIYLDTSGETLSRHGYRKIPGMAPMQENLASAVLMCVALTGDEHVINPMCGSGTLAIEAAMMATNRYPGLYRSNYSFMHFKGYRPEVYEQLKEKLRKEVKNEVSFKIIATDISQRVLEGARINADIAEVSKFIEFKKCDFFETPIPEGKGIVIFNPEYGERLGDVEKLTPIYKRMGDFLKQKCDGKTGYIFTGSPELSKVIGLRASKRTEFYNSKIDCRLFKYEMYKGVKGE